MGVCGLSGVTCWSSAPRIRWLPSVHSSTLATRPASTIAAVAGSAAFSENSKSHTAGFDRSVRSSAHARVDAAHGEELDMVVTWTEAAARHCGVPMVLEASLLDQ